MCGVCYVGGALARGVSHLWSVVGRVLRQAMSRRDTGAAGPELGGLCSEQVTCATSGRCPKM